MIRTTARLLVLLAAAVTLAACQDRSPPSSAAAPAGKPAATQQVSVDEIAAQAKGFTVGSEMSVRRVFVFFDPQCPHCATLWQAAKPLKSQARFIWIPVALLNPTSSVQGAAILAAADPVAAMDEHEELLTARKGGLTTSADNAEQKAMVASNTALMNRYGFGSVPVVVARHATSGEVVVREGSMPTAALAAVLGLQAPAAN